MLTQRVIEVTDSQYNDDYNGVFEEEVLIVGIGRFLSWFIPKYDQI